MDAKYTDKDIAAKAMIILEERLKLASGDNINFAEIAWSQAEQELIQEDEDNYRDLDDIQAAIDEAARKGSTPAALVERLMDAARFYKQQLDLTMINEEHYESRLKTRSKSKV